MNTPSEVLLSGLAQGESARWHDGRLWFANWGTGEIVAVGLDGKSEVMAKVPVLIPYCIDWLPDGRLLAVSGPEARVLVQAGDGWETYADLRGIAKGWNEIAVDSRGNAYVNGSDYDFMGGGPLIPGVVALVTPDGSVRQVADNILFPNGMVVTPGNDTLIVADSFAKQLVAFDITVDGSLSGRRVWAAMDDGPDGICLDPSGAVWAGSMNNCVRIREGGEVLQTVPSDRFCFSCALGGDDGKTLFIMAAEWPGVENWSPDLRTGQVQIAQV